MAVPVIDLAQEDHVVAEQIRQACEVTGEHPSPPPPCQGAPSPRAMTSLQCQLGPDWWAQHACCPLTPPLGPVRGTQASST